MRFCWVVGAVAAMACTDNPSIDGTMVPVLGPSPTCAEVCARIAALCGYAPLGDNCTTPDASGYCDTLLATPGSGDQPTLTCIGQASSCEQVWDTADGGCEYVPPTNDASADDATSDTGSE